MSDTPRTDAEDAIWQRDYNNHRECDWPPISDVVSSDFARQLERELDAANERIKRLEEESESRWHLAQSAIGSCAEMSSRIKRLEEAVSIALSNCYDGPMPEYVRKALLEAKETQP